MKKYQYKVGKWHGHEVWFEGVVDDDEMVLPEASVRNFFDHIDLDTYFNSLKHSLDAIKKGSREDTNVHIRFKD